MNLYQLPEFKTFNFSPFLKKIRNFPFLFLIILLSSFCGFLGGGLLSVYLYRDFKGNLEKIGLKASEKKSEQIFGKDYLVEFSHERAIVSSVKEISSSVVSIIVTKELPIIEEYWIYPFEGFEEFRIPTQRKKGTRKQEVGGGTGFIVSEEGFVLTNKHVVLDKDADYTILTNEGKKFQAKILSLDPLQDLAVLKIESPEKLKPVKLGDSSNLEIGQTVIAIGNALGEFRNTVSVGVISGLGRTITASGGGRIETLEDVIQTDAAINRGNSGGPLLNLKGEVIGINTAIAQMAENIGFAIPINKAKKVIEQVKEKGKVVYPFLGIRYVLINDKIREENNLPVNYGAWIIGNRDGEEAILSGSPAQIAGLKENDIILEFNNEKITPDNSLAKIISKYNPGDRVNLKVWRGLKELNIEIVLGERS